MPKFTPMESQELSTIEKLEKRPFWVRLLKSYRELLRAYGELHSDYEESKYEMSKKEYIAKDKHLEKMNNLNEVIRKQAESNRDLRAKIDSLLKSKLGVLSDYEIVDLVTTKIVGII